MQLPKRLTIVPIVEAVFEVRHQSNVPTSSVLPGLLFARLPGQKVFQKQAAAEIPEAFRTADPQLMYAPLSSFRWDEKFLVLFSNLSFAVACIAPYPGWTEFKQAILAVVKAVKDANILTSIDRCSLKYTNLIPLEVGNAFETLDFDLHVGRRRVSDGHFQLRSEVGDGDLLHIVQIISEGTLATSPQQKGPVIDVDTVRQFGPPLGPIEFEQTLNEALERHHTSTKAMFFACLKDSALKKLGPQYE